MSDPKFDANTTLPCCVHCDAQLTEAHFCGRCGKIQPIGGDSDFFSFFALPRKLAIDEFALEKTFYDLSRRLHPDYFMTLSPGEQQASVDRSSTLNDAYRALREPVTRAKYLLKLEGYKEAEKKAPPDLLEEVFELNMQVEELRSAKDTGDTEDAAEARESLKGALAGLKDRLLEIDQQLHNLFADWDDSGDSGDAGRGSLALEKMSELLSHRSYVSNLIEDVEEEI